MYIYTSKIFRKSFKKIMDFSFKKLLFAIDFKIKVLQKIKKLIQ